MDVISSIWPWRAYCFLDDEGNDVIIRWMDRENISVGDRSVLWSRLILLEEVGPHALPGSLEHLEDEFWTLSIKARAGGSVLKPILCYGPFYPDREITLLAGAPMEKGILEPIHLLPIARHNLETLNLNKRRRVPIYANRIA